MSGLSGLGLYPALAESAPPRRTSDATERMMTMSVFRRVLVPLEFESVTEKPRSEEEGVFDFGQGQWVRLSAETLEAVRLAGRLTAEFVELVHATPDLAAAAIYGGADGVWFPAQAMSEVEAAARAGTMRVLEKVGAAFLPKHQVGCHAAPGPAARVIMKLVEKYRPDAVVLAASARGRLRRAVVGSTVNRIVRQSPCPVVVVPTACD